RATRVLPPRASDHVAAVAADSRAWLGGTLEMGDPAAHENGIAPADGDRAVEHFICPSTNTPRTRCPPLPLVGRGGAGGAVGGPPPAPPPGAPRRPPPKGGG